MPDQKTDKSKIIKEKQTESPAGPLVEGRDYYIENGWWVFTEAYHLKRGYCCGSGCRHCAWGKGGVEKKGGF